MWQVNGEPISINGEKFYNHDQQSGGGGPIDLVMHVTGYTFTQAVAYLTHEAGPELAIAAAATHGPRERTAQAQEIVARGERAPFMQPVRDEDRWPQVRAYLVEQRQLPAGLVDELHERGTIYADSRANAVFLRTNEEGQAVSASLRGTLPGSEFQGLAYGTRRDEGHFSFTIGNARAVQRAAVPHHGEPHRRAEPGRADPAGWRGRGVRVPVHRRSRRATDAADRRGAGAAGPRALWVRQRCWRQQAVGTSERGVPARRGYRARAAAIGGARTGTVCYAPRRRARRGQARDRRMIGRQGEGGGRAVTVVTSTAEARARGVT